MRFRSLPVEIEAEQFTNESSLPIGVRPYLASEGDHGRRGFYVVTIHGARTDVVAGDWIITEPNGVNHYPCKPDIFQKRYVPATDSREGGEENA